MRSATAGFGERDHHAAGVRETHVFEHLDLARIAVYDRIARLPAGADAIRIEIERDVFEAGLLEHAGDVLPDAAEAANDDVIALGDRERRPASRIASVCRGPVSRKMARVMRRL